MARCAPCQTRHGVPPQPSQRGRPAGEAWRRDWTCRQR